MFWEFEFKMETEEQNLKRTQQALEDVRKELMGAWKNKLGSRQVAELREQATRLERKERDLKRKLTKDTEKLHRKVQKYA